ncbi:hypothetical protein Tco_0531720 [Tanacetum coccineum]
MHIRNDPSFFLTNKTGAPQGEELGLTKPLSGKSFSCSKGGKITLSSEEGVQSIRCPCYWCMQHGTQIHLKIHLSSRQEGPATCIWKYFEKVLELLCSKLMFNRDPVPGDIPSPCMIMVLFIQWIANNLLGTPQLTIGTSPKTTIHTDYSIKST